MNSPIYYKKLKTLSGEILRPISYYSKYFNQDFYMVVHVHNYYEIMYCQEGSFTFEVYSEDGKTLINSYEITTKQFVLIDAGLSHRVSIKDTARIINIEFAPISPSEYNPFFINNYATLNMRRFFQLDGLERWATAEALFVIGIDNRNLEHYLQRYLALLISDEESLDRELKLRSRFLQVFIELNHCLSFGKKNTGIIHIKKAQSYIEQNFLKPITVDDVASAVGIHKAYLQRLFKSHTGNTIIKALNDLRIEKCKNLLLETNMTLDEICQYTGFTNRQHLIYEFKCSTGKSPADYRKEFEKNELHHFPSKYDSINFWDEEEK